MKILYKRVAYSQSLKWWQHSSTWVGEAISRFGRMFCYPVGLYCVFMIHLFHSEVSKILLLFGKTFLSIRNYTFPPFFFFFKVDLPLFFSFFLSKEGNKWIKTTWRYKINLLVKSLILTNDYMKFLLRINLAQFTCTTFLPSLVILVGSYKILLHMNFARTEFILMNNLYPIFLGKLPLKLNEPFLEEKDKFGRIT